MPCWADFWRAAAERRAPKARAIIVNIAVPGNH
jgi:hypothetical protein